MSIIEMMRTKTISAPKSLQRLALFLPLASALFAQFSVAQFSAIDPKGEETERAQINQAIVEANHSPIDVIAALEKHLRNTPNTHLRGEIEQLLAKESMEAKDTLRIVRYGVPTLTKTPNDAQLLDRVTASLLNIGGVDNAQKALEFARRFEDYVVRVPVPTGSDAVRNQEDHDRALERALLYQARVPGRGRDPPDCGRRRSRWARGRAQRNPQSGGRIRAPSARCPRRRCSTGWR